MFVSAVKNYDSENGKLLTYATYYINGELSKELDLLLNPLGLTERPRPEKKSVESENSVISRISIDEDGGITENVLSYALMRDRYSDDAETDMSEDGNPGRMSEIAGLMRGLFICCSHMVHTRRENLRYQKKGGTIFSGLRIYWMNTFMKNMNAMMLWICWQRYWRTN